MNRVNHKSVSGNLQKELRDMRVIEISLTSLLAGTKVRGEFEERMEAVVREASMEPKPLLFIDEIHLILGAGSASGSMDAANILKPALALCEFLTQRRRDRRGTRSHTDETNFLF